MIYFARLTYDWICGIGWYVVVFGDTRVILFAIINSKRRLEKLIIQAYRDVIH